MTLELKEEDGKQVGEVVVGVTGLRLGSPTKPKPCPQKQIILTSTESFIPPGMTLPPGSYIASYIATEEWSNLYGKVHACTDIWIGQNVGYRYLCIGYCEVTQIASH